MITERDLSAGSREEVWIRCIKCGWEGWAMWIKEYGLGSLSVEYCPSRGCGMPVELSDD